MNATQHYQLIRPVLDGEKTIEQLHQATGVPLSTLHSILEQLRQEGLEGCQPITQEQRELARLDADWSLSYQLVDDDQVIDDRASLRNPIQGKTLNVSEGGICFTTPRELLPESTVLLRVHSDWLVSPLFALACIRWCGSKDVTFVAGAKFVWSGWDTKEVQQAVIRYIESNTDAASIGTEQTGSKMCL